MAVRLVSVSLSLREVDKSMMAFSRVTGRVAGCHHNRGGWGGSWVEIRGVGLLLVVLVLTSLRLAEMVF